MKMLLTGTMGFVLAGTLALSAADVKVNWDAQCAKCHGDDGTGKTKMGRKLKVKDYSDASVQAMMKDEDMFQAIKDGVKKDNKTVMQPAKDMSEDDMKALVTYIRAMAKK